MIRQFMPRKRIALPASEFTNARAAFPRRSENFEHRCVAYHYLEVRRADPQPRTSGEVRPAEVQVDVELITRQWPAFHVACRQCDAPSVPEGDLSAPGDGCGRDAHEPPSSRDLAPRGFLA